MMRAQIRLLCLLFATCTLSVIPNITSISAPAIAQTVSSRKAEADRLLKQGNEQIEKSSQEAIKVLQQAIKIYQDIDDRAGEGQTLKSLGNAYYTLKEYQKAIDYQQQTLVIAREIRDRDLEARGLNNLGSAYRGLKNSARAIDFYEQALKITKSEKNYVVEQLTLRNLFSIHYELGDVSKLTEVGQSLLFITKASKNQDLMAAILIDLSNAYTDFGGDYKESIKLAQEGLEVARKIENSTLEIKALLSLSRAYHSSKENEMAGEYAIKALEVSRRIKSSELEATGLILIASINSVSKPHRVLNVVNKIGLLQKNIQESSPTLFLVAHQANLLVVKKGIEIAEKIQNSQIILQGLNLLASIAHEDGDYEIALQAAQLGWNKAVEFQDQRARFQAMSTLVSIYADLGDYQKINQLLRTVIGELKNYQSPFLEMVRFTLLSANSFIQGDYNTAIDMAQQGQGVTGALLSMSQFRVKDVKQFESFNLYMLGVSHGNLKNYQEAIRFLEKSREKAKAIGDEDQESNCLNALGSIYWRFGDLEKALSYYHEALTIYDEDYSAWTGLARIYRDLKMPFAAIAYYKKSIAGIEESREDVRELPTDLQKNFLHIIDIDGKTKYVDSYRELADLLLSQGQILEAQQILELLKVQEIREFDLTTRAKISETGELLSLDHTEQKITEKYGSYIEFMQKVRSCQEKTPQCPELDRLMASRQQAKDEYDRTIQSLSKELEARQAKDKENFLDPTNPLSNKAARLIDNRTDRAVIYSLVTDNRLWLVVATQGAPLRPFEIKVSRKELSAAVKTFRELMEKCQQPGYVCTTADTEAVKAASQKLYTWLFPAELQKELPPDRIKHLMFSLDRNIRYIPMSALFDGKQYLIEKYAVSSITTADRPENEPFSRTAQNTKVLAMGASEFPDGLPPLPNVEVELNEIVKASNRQDSSGIYTGLEFLNTNFSKRNLQNSLYGQNILHLASHGIFSLTSPQNSYIALGDKDRLSIPEISRILDLSTIDLVVLSACQTALGGRENEEGVEIASLGSAFLQNQAKSVMASLWNVDDISTSLLMREFYQNLAKNTAQVPITRAEAIRQAQLRFIQGEVTISDAKELRSRASIAVFPTQPTSDPNRTPDYRHPYYWSPFVLMGSGF
ncbi:CHAT domain-containing protein [Leptolyngbya boryana CZ1]|uniref:CHAT domain-containing protein n=1 Tax=Leptolyngbya boryana CZ1 TaxID=3060204 RepID=A0AA97AME7_LEPBY|nr:CHAT domain-containing protein [Leptolyngbya boryana]WNZ44137.1 CHAT domain-containing protein [Leptolyngbya boryana CZ1]